MYVSLSLCIYVESILVMNMNIKIIIIIMIITNIILL